MKRRKLLIGLGALAAGGTAAIGTGALDQSEIDRNVDGQVVGDGSAYLKISSISDYSEVAGNGQVRISFDDIGDQGGNQPDGDGLNQDSENWFDCLVKLGNRAEAGSGPLEVTVESNVPRLRFYWCGQPWENDPNYPTNAWADQNSVTIHPDGDPNTNNNVKFGAYVDMEDVDQPQSVFNGNDDFTIYADRA